MRHAVIFDLDGTLSDSTRAIVATMNASLDAFGLPKVEEAAVHALIGIPLDDMVARLVPAGGPWLQVADRYRALYVGIASDIERPFPGVRELLADLHGAGRPLAIATGKSQHGADQATARLGLRPWFRAIHGIAPGTPGKPHPALLERVLADLGCAADEAVVVGDTTFDLEMARAAGVPSIAVTWGCHAPEALRAARPDAMVADLSELAAILELRGL